MATYMEIQDYIKLKHGYSVKTCWIAHMKEVCGLKPKKSPNRHSPISRVHPCPLAKQNDVREAFQHFKMI
ncbi:hypothetical protein PH210_06150 [Paenibacillus sp. BSR1-1]|uniref:hypothetical protein n=1 Tax=Paenibacillus sp. BSR1-1 TaxID=3020845 RepID=UPI0025AFEF66|nr:hypothetical protein [Paenibacillus sp. BSR1-1]MDN3015787.1 hypothetical protein [Paenibacillus sp. BSR1-1]